MRRHPAIALVVLAATLFGCRGPEAPSEPEPGPCLPPESLYHRSTLAFLARFRSELQSAKDAPRARLGGILDDLAKTRELDAQLRPPACAGLFQRHVLDAMDAEIVSIRKFRDLDGEGLRRWAAAGGEEKREMLDRTHVEYAWKLVTFELEILEKRPNVLSPEPRPGSATRPAEP